MICYGRMLEHQNTPESTSFGLYLNKPNSKPNYGEIKFSYGANNSTEKRYYFGSHQQGKTSFGDINWASCQTCEKNNHKALDYFH